MTETLLAIAIAVLAVIGAFFGGKRKARKETEQRINDALQADKARRMDAGRDAVERGRASGADPDERVRENDNRW
ncbi:hypothetical protein [Mameliella alba]|uniref:Uncharacterized protein n=1 Tax=Mameliella alba TaxID=561184 RepID=A0A0B3SKK8_9RHOB|nr:hypothetical protein [Mameliella alba]KHQ51084.1 hypothetical protein OA50_04455 [Mameliella alba]